MKKEKRKNSKSKKMSQNLLQLAIYWKHVPTCLKHFIHNTYKKKQYSSLPASPLSALSPQPPVTVSHQGISWKHCCVCLRKHNAIMLLLLLLLSLLQFLHIIFPSRPRSTQVMYSWTLTHVLDTLKMSHSAISLVGAGCRHANVSHGCCRVPDLRN